MDGRARVHPDDDIIHMNQVNASTRQIIALTHNHLGSTLHPENPSSDSPSYQHGRVCQKTRMLAVLRDSCFRDVLGVDWLPTETWCEDSEASKSNSPMIDAAYREG
jgi:hypothetical protein